LKHVGKQEGSLFRKMQDWLGRSMPAEAKDNMNKVQDFLEVSFQSMVLAFTASMQGLSLDQDAPPISKVPSYFLRLS
jgi:hypothetical protein